MYCRPRLQACFAAHLMVQPQSGSTLPALHTWIAHKQVFNWHVCNLELSSRGCSSPQSGFAVYHNLHMELDHTRIVPVAISSY